MVHPGNCEYSIIELPFPIVPPKPCGVKGPWGGYSNSHVSRLLAVGDIPQDGNGSCSSSRSTLWFALMLAEALRPLRTVCVGV